jgi:hypothetical protein
MEAQGVEVVGEGGGVPCRRRGGTVARVAGVEGHRLLRSHGRWSGQRHVHLGVALWWHLGPRPEQPRGEDRRALRGTRHRVHVDGIDPGVVRAGVDGGDVSPGLLLALVPAVAGCRGRAEDGLAGGRERHGRG